MVGIIFAKVTDKLYGTNIYFIDLNQYAKIYTIVNVK
jgi:hypothetical protein